MSSDRWLPRKLTFRVDHRVLVVDKRPDERPEHRIMMALVWARYLASYPELRVDVPIGTRYRPDLIQLGADGKPVFWGECGAVSREKLDYLCRRYRDTHLVFTRWDSQPLAFAELITQAQHGVRRSEPIELLGFDETALAAIGEDGTITPDIPSRFVQRWVSS